MAKSYYTILNISSDASSDEIRSAYRRLAMQYHPDHYLGSNDVFRDIQEAYAVLADANKKRHYDQRILHENRPVVPVQPLKKTPEPLIPEDGPQTLEDISPTRSFERFTPSYDEVYDWLWRNFSNIEPPKSGHIKNLTLEVPITDSQARCGGNVRVMVPVYATCPICHGDGGVGPYLCSSCSGEGSISGEAPIYVSFPRGLVKNHAVVIPLERFGIHNMHMTVLFRPTDHP